MMQSRLTRRAVVRGAAGAAAGVATAAAASPEAVARDPRHDTPTPPEPIPGGIELAPGNVIHVWAPGPPEVTLPFSRGQLQGLDTEPTTIKDFRGFSAVAFHVGTATGRDGTRYDYETDVRAFRGTYVDATGARHFGTFGFI